MVARTMRDVSEADALSYVLGYTCAVDVTARDKQRSDLQWARGKSADGFCPVGPWLETDLGVSAVGVQTRLNGELKQDGNTRDLIFSVPSLIARLSETMTLFPGDLIFTGTPAGVGFGRTPQRFLQPGEELCSSIEGIGEMRQVFVEEQD